MVWSYPRGTDVSKDGETALDVVAYAAQIAAQLGAHVIKVKPPTEHIEQAEAKKVYEKAKVPIATLAERVRHVVQSAFDGRRIVIFSGGATKENDEAIFDECRGIRDGGGFGSIIGRNSFQRPRDHALRVPGHRDEDLRGRDEVAAGPARARSLGGSGSRVPEARSRTGAAGASEDELGTINLITPAKRQAAARLVTDGVSVTCARPIATDITPDTTFQPVRFMVDSGEGRDTVSPERARQRRGASEFIGMVFHGYTITHVDAPSHYFWDGRSTTGARATGDLARGGHRRTRSRCCATG